MSDVKTDTTAVSPPPPSPPPPPASHPPPPPPAVVDAADWRAGLDGEVKEFASRFSSPADLAKAGFELRKANGSMVRVPGKDAKPEDIAKYHKAIGVPDTDEGYEFAYPEGHEITDADKAIQGAVAKAFREHGVPAAAAKAASKAVADMASAQFSEQERVATAARQEAEASLRKEWGAEYDGNVQLAVRAIEKLGSPKLKEYLNTVIGGRKVGDHPELVRLFGTVGRRMGEGDLLTVAGGTQRQTLVEERAQLLRDNPPGTDKYKAPAVQRRMQQISEQLAGAEPL